MGKYHTIFEPGLNILIPFIDKVKYIQSLKEIAIDIPQQSAITVDNVTLQIDGTAPFFTERMLVIVMMFIV